MSTPPDNCYAAITGWIGNLKAAVDRELSLATEPEGEWLYPLAAEARLPLARAQLALDQGSGVAACERCMDVERLLRRISERRSRVHVAPEAVQ